MRKLAVFPDILSLLYMAGWPMKMPSKERNGLESLSTLEVHGYFHTCHSL
jgi:hypothetical protein